MSEVYFYHLTQTSLHQTIGELAKKSLANDWRVIIRGTDTNNLVALDKLLWESSPEEFLPHGFLTGENDKAQPVLLTEQKTNINAADVLMLVDASPLSLDEIPTYKRVCLIFDGTNPDAVDAARNEWKALVNSDIPALYWSQETGQWKMKQRINAAE